MANIAFKKGLLANLPSTYTEGTIYPHSPDLLPRK